MKSIGEQEHVEYIGYIMMIYDICFGSTLETYWNIPKQNESSTVLYGSMVGYSSYGQFIVISNPI